MFRNTRWVALVFLTFPVAFVLACGGSSQPPAQQAAAPAEPAKPAADVAKHMHDHLARVTDVQEAVIRGDLDAAVEPAKWIADHQETEGLPADTETIVADMKRLAAAITQAEDIKSASTSTAMLVSYCGQCHAAAKITPKLPEIAKPAGGRGVTAHMMEHQWAMDLLYQGLMAPSDALWTKGVAAMQAAPLAGASLPKDAKLTKEILASEKQVHELAAKALAAMDIGSKVAVYGELLGNCASCHGLHGKVWGPGLPKKT